jgi:hypothetical protein
MNARGRLIAHVMLVGMPVGIFAAARVLLDPAPVIASAAVLPTPLTSAASEPKALTPQQQKALEWSRSAAITGARSPLGHLLTEPAKPEPLAARAVAVETPEPVQTPWSNPIEGLRLSAVMGTADESAMAVINGKVYKVGDHPTARLTLIAIDARKQRVQLQDERGGVHTIGREEP